MILIGGDGADATLTIYATDTGCATKAPLGTWGLSALLAGARAWRTGCIPVRPAAPVEGIGFTFAGKDVDLGFSAPRFGPACPAP